MSIRSTSIAVSDDARERAPVRSERRARAPAPLRGRSRARGGTRQTIVPSRRSVPAERPERGDDAVVVLRIADRVEQARDDVERAAVDVEVAHVALDEPDAVARRGATDGEQLLVDVGRR